MALFTITTNGPWEDFVLPITAALESRVRGPDPQSRHTFYQVIQQESHCIISYGCNLGSFGIIIPVGKKKNHLGRGNDPGHQKEAGLLLHIGVGRNMEWNTEHEWAPLNTLLPDFDYKRHGTATLT